MKKVFISLIMLVFLLLPGFSAKADGGLIPPHPDDPIIYEPNQAGLILYSSGQEDLYLKVNYQGSASKFAWLVPTPHYPSITKALAEIFNELSDYTSPIYDYEQLNRAPSGGATDNFGKNVIVHEQKQVGIYQTAILSAAGADGLFYWLSTNGFEVSEEVRSVLDWYVKKQWYFTALRINPGEVMPLAEIMPRLDYIQPIHISFATRTIVYPLKISQVSTRLPENTKLLKTNEVLLYVLNKDRVKAPGFTAEYAEMISPTIIKNKEADRGVKFTNLKEIVTSEFFLTKLRRSFAKAEMDEDLYLISGSQSESLLSDKIVPLAESYLQDENYLIAKKNIFGSALADRLKGKIVLRVEKSGEAYYINPLTHLKMYLGRPYDSFMVMRGQGVGISNANLNKIPLGVKFFSGLDSDGDGLPDLLETAIGTDKHKIDTDNDGRNDLAEILADYQPNGPSKLVYDYNFSEKQKGKIFLQVENHGEAWYVNPADGKRYFLGRPDDAFNLMKNLGLGIAEEDFFDI